MSTWWPHLRSVILDLLGDGTWHPNILKTHWVFVMNNLSEKPLLRIVASRPVCIRMPQMADKKDFWASLSEFMIQ